ncbi:MAG: phosphoribosylformylglycinamidine synthase subunit PurS [Fimbriimonadales bacterium]|nr:phosphoribosylformylglycinamidine synthase subunit PurS [Fimbriimonadales bacterium]
MSRYRVVITLKPALLDPAGRTVGESLRALGFSSVKDVRIGKVVELELSDGSLEEVREMCQRLLVNPVIETYEVEECA